MEISLIEVRLAVTFLLIAAFIYLHRLCRGMQYKSQFPYHLFLPVAGRVGLSVAAFMAAIIGMLFKIWEKIMPDSTSVLRSWSVVSLGIALLLTCANIIAVKVSEHKKAGTRTSTRTREKPL